MSPDEQRTGSVEITIDDQMPPHALYITCSRLDHFSVTLSPDVEPGVLTALIPEIALALADEIDSGRGEQRDSR